MNIKINLATTKLEEALAAIETYAIEDVKDLAVPSVDVQKLWNLAWGFEDKSENRKENAAATIEFVMKHQDEFGLVEILRDSKMPADARCDFWYKPSYALASILIYYHTFDTSFLDEVPERRAAFNKLLKACLGRKLKGHGYDAEIEKLEILELFAGNRFFKFFQQRPEGCEDFFSIVGIEIAKILHQVFYRGPVEVNAFGKVNCSDTAYRIAAKFAGKKNLVFLYGTLLPGERAAHMLGDAYPLGKGLLPNFAMYNLGNFPGIVIGDDEDYVEGKVYCVNDEQLASFDSYESEGTLYRREIVDVVVRNATIPCFAYVFNRPIPDGAEKLVNWKDR